MAQIQFLTLFNILLFFRLYYIISFQIVLHSHYKCYFNDFLYSTWQKVMVYKYRTFGLLLFCYYK